MIILPELTVLLTYNSSLYFKCGCPPIPPQVSGRQQYTYNSYTHSVDYNRMNFRCDGTLPDFFPLRGKNLSGQQNHYIIVTVSGPES